MKKVSSLAESSDPPLATLNGEYVDEGEGFLDSLLSYAIEEEDRRIQPEKRPECGRCRLQCITILTSAPDKKG